MDSNALDNNIFSEGIGSLSSDITGELKVGDVTLEIDASDPDFLEKLQEAGYALQSFSAPAGSDSERTRALVEEIDRRFDDLFGEGTAAMAFKTKSLMKRIKAWGSIVELANAQKDALTDKMSEFNNRYNAGNRAQRRAEAKKKRQFPNKKGSS